MIFGPCSVDSAEGTILAHSLILSDGPVRKGTILTKALIARIASDGLGEITVARLEAGDMPEDDAARMLGAALRAPGLKESATFTGRLNLIAEMAGVVQVNAVQVAALNGVDEGLTLATLPDLMRVHADQLVGTVKVIPYGLPKDAVERGVAALGHGAVKLHPFQGGRARLILTRTSGFKESLLAKSKKVVRERIEALGYEMGETAVVDHSEGAVAVALREDADLFLILGASATSDRGDVAPAAVVRAGGQIDRFGMPVDPGNLLFLGKLRGKPVVGLPGCARSPALNGVDWVLERLAAGIAVDGDAIAAMGVGGLLKEMPGRPQPRRPNSG